MGETSVSLSSRRLADLFNTSSDDDQAFSGFSDAELGGYSHKDDKHDDNETTSKRPSRFQIRVALRSHSRFPLSDHGEAVDSDEEEHKTKLDVKGENLPQSDSETERQETFLEKRAMNIKANKAMLAQLMADLNKMPAMLLQAQQNASKKAQQSRVLPSPKTPREARRNPERATRRHTRSMGASDDVCENEDDKKLEMSLEEELLEVRRAPRQRGNPRTNQAKPHLVRSVEDITEEEIDLVADAMTEKVYNSATGSTCHQCRQKTVDTKTCCRNADCRGIQGQFCGPCLRNRYGEDVRSALLNPAWHCPPCRGICNCSFCRQRDGRCPTGILFPLAQFHGFSDVHSYLTRSDGPCSSGLRARRRIQHIETLKVM